LSWTLSDGAAWLQLSPASGTTTTETDTISASVTTSGLAAGTYNSFLAVTAPGAPSSPRYIPVSLTLTAAPSTPAIGLNQSSLGFAGTVGGTNPSAQTIAISNVGGGTLSWAASDNAAWLTLSPVSGTNNGTMTANVNLTGLAAGTYNTAISVTALGATPKTVPVTLTLSASTSSGTIGALPSNLAFSGTVGGTNPATQTFALTNTGGGTLSWTLSDGAAWLQLSPASGTTTTETDTISASVTTSGLAAGTYNSFLAVTAPGAPSSPRYIPVSLTLTAAPSTPAIGLNTTSLGFAGTVGGTNPSAQTIGVSNVGGGTLTWNAGVNATWLTLSPSSGTNTGTVTATVNLVGLLSGSYTATVTVTATGATPKTLPVTLTVTGSTSGGTIGFSPANLAFSGTVGGTNPAAKTFSITNTGGGTLSWTLSDNATWLQLNTASGTTTSETDTISASATLSGLAAGTYNATITIMASGSTNSPQQIPVSLTLSTTAAGTASLTWNTSTESDLAGYKVYRGTASGTYGAPLATLPKTTASYTTTGLQTGTTYFFAITSYDSSGNESTFSNEVSKSIF
jgi:cytolysin (calcineurin-like family phosphatase)